MKKLLYTLTTLLAVSFTACNKADFEDSYANPSKISSSSVEKQFSGFMFANNGYVLPAYTNYFVVLRTTITHYTQAVGWVNSPNQYIPGAAGIGNRWDNYYYFLSQYREMQNLYGKLSQDDQKDKRIYMIAATIYLYDHTQKVVDLHGDIPWSEAGMMSANGGAYTNSLPKYDNAEAIYTKMLDDLKGFSDELNSITLSAAAQAGFNNQDLINKGSLVLWKKYCNSLRLRLLTRVSNSASLKTRANIEIAAILASPVTYPVIADNSENIQMNVFDLASSINSKGFQNGFESWDGNIAGKAMIDHMNTNADPRLRVMFEPGVNAAGVYKGLDPALNSGEQGKYFNAGPYAGTLAMYNRSTFSRNQYFPGVLMNSAEVSFLAAEAFLKAGNDAAAKAAYNDGIAKSVKFYYAIRSLSNNNLTGTVKPTSDAEIATYIAKPAVNWDLALTDNAKLNLIATQKWIHYSVVEPVESWSEIRRLDLPSFTFEQDDSNAQKLPPYRWFYAGSESTYNSVNYSTVKAKDNLTTKIFWDVN